MAAMSEEVSGDGGRVGHFEKVWLPSLRLETLSIRRGLCFLLLCFQRAVNT